ncbi:MAG TPA: hypothetical protein VF006_09625 [Longimicrobium sp.]
MWHISAIPLRVCGAAAVLLLVTAPLLSAQATEADSAHITVQKVLVTPSATAGIRSSVPVFFLSGSAQKTEARVQGGFRLMDDPSFGRLHATVGVTAPLSEDEGEQTVFGDLGGLTGGTTLSLSVTGQRWRWDASAGERTAWCERMKKKGRVASGADCVNFDLTAVTTGNRELRRDFWLEVERERPVLYEISARYQPEEMRYLDAETFLPETLERSSGSVGVSIGRFLGTQLWSVSYRYESAYVEGPAAEVCVPVGVAGALRCRKAPLGEPVRQESSVGTAQTRGYFGRTVAWNPRLTYRFADKEWGLEVPIYFVPGEAGLVGGVTPGFNSIDNRWTFTVFFGKAFRVGL